MSLSGSVYAEAPLTDSTVINGDTTINVDIGANSGINLSGNKEISLAASASDADSGKTNALANTSSKCSTLVTSSLQKT